MELTSNIAATAQYMCTMDARAMQPKTIWNRTRTQHTVAADGWVALGHMMESGRWIILCSVKILHLAAGDQTLCNILQREIRHCATSYSRNFSLTSRMSCRVGSLNAGVVQGDCCTGTAVTLGTHMDPCPDMCSCKGSHRCYLKYSTWTAQYIMGSAAAYLLVNVYV